MKNLLLYLGITFTLTTSFQLLADTPPSFCKLGTVRDLTAEGPDYVALGYKRRFKGDYPV